MNAYAVISRPTLDAPPGIVERLVAGLFGGRPAAYLARPRDARLVANGDGLAFQVADEAHWLSLYRACQPKGLLLFTTAPAARLTRWFGGAAELRVTCLNLQMVLRRPGGRNEQREYADYGPYWRRFLLATQAAVPEPGAQLVTFAAEDESLPLWPVCCRPQGLRDHPGLPALLESAEELLGDPFGFLLPPWMEVPAAGGYWCAQGAGATGVSFRQRLRHILGRSQPSPGEPLALTLARAADDPALRPEMVAGVEIEIGGLPAHAGAAGEGTRAVLRLAPLRPEEPAMAFRRRAVFGEEPHRGLMEGLRASVASDLDEAFGAPTAGCAWERSARDDAEPVALAATPRPGALPNAAAPIFRMVERLEAADRASGGPVLTGFSARFLTAGLPLENPAVDRFIADYWRPTSRQTYTANPEFWRSVLLFQEGALLGPNELSQPADRPLELRVQVPGHTYPLVEKTPPGTPFHVRVALEPGRALEETVLRVALVMPAGTVIRRGTYARLDDPLTALDGGALLG